MTLIELSLLYPHKMKKENSVFCAIVYELLGFFIKTIFHAKNHFIKENDKCKTAIDIKGHQIKNNKT